MIPPGIGVSSSRPPIPRRVYTQSHIDFVAEAVLEVFRHREEFGGYRILEAPKMLRHFTARLAPLPVAVESGRA